VSLSSSTRTPSAGARAAGRPAGGATRLPSGRERRPALAALAVILILLGAAGSALIALNSGNRSDFVAIASDKPLPPGHKIDAKDFARGDLAGATGDLVPWSQASKYVGRYTTSWLYKNQYVTPENFTKEGEQPIPSGGALVGLSLDAGHSPSDGLSVGDIVSVTQVPAANEAGSATTLVSGAEVTSASGAITDSKTSANTTLNVTVLVPAEKVNTVAAAAVAKTVVVAKLPAGTKPEISRNGGSK
jgi:hypothetical protein